MNLFTLCLLLSVNFVSAVENTASTSTIGSTEVHETGHFNTETGHFNTETGHFNTETGHFNTETGHFNTEIGTNESRTHQFPDRLCVHDANDRDDVEGHDGNIASRALCGGGSNEEDEIDETPLNRMTAAVDRSSSPQADSAVMSKNDTVGNYNPELSQVDGGNFTTIHGEDSLKNNEETWPTTDASNTPWDVDTLCEAGVESPWSCQGQCGQHVNTSCSCVQSCQIQKNCCPDFQRLCPQDFNTTASVKDNFPKVQSSCSDRHRVLLISSCPPGADDADRDRCEEVLASSLNVSDLFPVTDSESGLHFQNVHCWRCSSASGRPLPWRANATFTWSTAPPEDYTLSSLMTYIRDNSELVLWFPETPFGFSRCFPDHWTVSECPDHAGAEEKENCERTLSYTLVKNKLYKNRFCYECSDERDNQQGVHHCSAPPPTNSGDLHVVLSVSTDSSGEEKIMVKGELQISVYSWMVLECWEEADVCLAKSCRTYTTNVRGRCTDSYKPIYAIVKICRLEKFEFPFICRKPYEAESWPQHVDAFLKNKCRAGKHVNQRKALSNDTGVTDNEDGTNGCVAAEHRTPVDFIQNVSIKMNPEPDGDMFLNALKSIFDAIQVELDKESNYVSDLIRSVTYEVSKEDGGVFIKFRGILQSSHKEIMQRIETHLIKRLPELGFAGRLALCLSVSRYFEMESRDVQSHGTCIPVSLCPETDWLSDSDIFELSDQTKAMSGGSGGLVNGGVILETLLLLVAMVTFPRCGIVMFDSVNT